MGVHRCTCAEEGVGQSGHHTACDKQEAKIGPIELALRTGRMGKGSRGGDQECPLCCMLRAPAIFHRRRRLEGGTRARGGVRQRFVEGGARAWGGARRRFADGMDEAGPLRHVMQRLRSPLSLSCFGEKRLRGRALPQPAQGKFTVL
eukprot:gene17959-biopygen3846